MPQTILDVEKAGRWHPSRSWPRHHLDQLAEAVRESGLKAEATPNDEHQPFPGLTVAIGAASAVVLAGSAHYWRRAPQGDFWRVGPLDDPAQAARAVRKHLMDGRLHAHERVKK